jgi:hypothetical protein
MLAALWALEGRPGEQTGELLRWTRQMPCPEPTMAFLFTDGRACPAPSAEASAGGARVFVVQVGAQEPDPRYGAACAASGGAVLAVPPGLPPAEAALLLARNVEWPGYTELTFTTPTSEVEKLRILTPVGAFSNAPVIIAYCRAGDGYQLDGNLQAKTADAACDLRMSDCTGCRYQLTMKNNLSARLREGLLQVLAPPAPQRPSP